MKNRTTTGGYGLTLAEARQYLRISSDDTAEDTLISALITASYEQACAECNRDFTNTAYTMSIASASGYIYLTGQDVNSVSTGTLVNLNGVSYTYMDSLYSGAISYTVASGSVTTPPSVKVAQLMLVSQWFDNRQSTADGRGSKLDFTVEAILSPFKLITPSYDGPATT